MKLEVTEEAEKDLADLDRETRGWIKTALDRLLSYPQVVDIKKLKGSQNMWRLGVGDRRVILRLDQGQGVLYLLRIRHRGSIAEQMDTISTMRRGLTESEAGSPFQPCA